MTSGRPQGLAADREHWARFAEEWVAWARRPNHDSFWSYQHSLADFIGAGAGAALDLGCGEGRVARELLALGYRVTAVDPVRELLDAARQVRSAHHYAVAEASRLLFNDGSFDLVVAYNALMDVEDLAASVGGDAAGRAPDGAHRHLGRTSIYRPRTLRRFGS
jgi:2-polyprenyl-3-methyl-5-hydroxy-6-metoxy-1,4-benzoquinol methylase